MLTMHRRQFCRTGLGLASLGLAPGCGLPLPRTQPSGVHRIAYFASGPPTPFTWPAFQQGLRDLGYVEGENIVVEYRNAKGGDQLAEPAAELVRTRPEVIAVPAV